MPDNQARHTIDFQPAGRRVEISSGETVLDAARQGGVGLLAVCGGIGLCQDCLIRLISGTLTGLTPEEISALTGDQIDSGYRLACQARPQSDCRIDIPPESLSTPQRLRLEGIDHPPAADPVTRVKDIRLVSQFRHQDDTQSLSAFLRQMDTPALAYTPQQEETFARMRHGLPEFIRVVHSYGRLVALLPERQPVFGLAVDMGSTKLAAYLVNLEDGVTVARTGAMNPQIAFGEDVVSRIGYADRSEANRLSLQRILINSMNGMITDLCGMAGCSNQQIVDAVLVGNTVIHHLTLGLPVRNLGVAPYTSPELDSVRISPTTMGLQIHPDAMVYFPPNIAGYVGSDHVAMQLAIEPPSTNERVLALDIGTNTEVSLWSDGNILTCSCASGPAFEGARIQDGMRAAPGAIEKVELYDHTLKCGTINDAPPVGICGSGILDAIAVMMRDGAINPRGTLKLDHPRVVESRSGHGYLLVAAQDSGTDQDIIVTRRDVNEIQLAKAAMRAGCEILLGEAGIAVDDLTRFVVAGAFGTYLDVDSAVTVGMFPDLPRDKFLQVGNAAGAGARQMLVSRSARERAEVTARSSRYVELTTHPGFMDIYIKAMHLG